MDPVPAEDEGLRPVVNFSQDPALQSARHIAVTVLQLQRATGSNFTTLPLSSVLRPLDVVDMSEKAFDAYGQGLQFLEVIPQLRSDTAVLLSVPTKCLSDGRIPVLPGEPARFGMDMFDPNIRGDDIQATLSTEWTPEYNVSRQVPDSHSPFSTWSIDHHHPRRAIAGSCGLCWQTSGPG